MVKEKYLKLTGNNDRVIHNTFWTQQENSSKLAILFPGLRYPTEAPLFHFLKLHLLSNGWSVLSLEYRYNEIDSIQNFKESDCKDYILSEAKIIQKQLESQLDFDQYCFVGKSIGTSVLFTMLENNLTFVDKVCQFVWLTPAGLNKEISEYIIANKISSIYIIGDADPFFNEDIVSNIEKNITGYCLIVPKAGHLFNEGEDLMKTMDNTKEVIKFLAKNISKKK